MDTIGLLLVVAVSAASVRDRHAGRTPVWAVRTCYRQVTLTWADSGYNGTLTDYAAALGITVMIARNSPDRSASRSCRGVGSWEGPCRESADAAGPSATTNADLSTTPRSSNGQ